MARKKKEQGGGGGSPAWMSTFSDLMNLLLCFFVLLFSMSTIDAEKLQQVAASFASSFSILPDGGSSIGEGILVSSGASQLTELGEYFKSLGMESNGKEDEDAKDAYEEILQEGMKESENMADYIGDRLENENLSNQVTVTVTSSYVMLNINGGVLFDSGEIVIKEEAKGLLTKVADVIKVYDDNTIEIIGHTDNVPISAGLKAKYEDNMVLSQYRAHSVYLFLRDKGFSEDSMKSVGRGEAKPIASNDTAEGRAQNRRVEIKIYNIYNSN